MYNEIKGDVENTQDSDYKWFEENLGELYQRYGDAYVIIKNKTVLGSYRTFHKAVEIARETECPGTYIVQKCAEKIDDLYVYIYTPYF